MLSRERNQSLCFLTNILRERERGNIKHRKELIPLFAYDSALDGRKFFLSLWRTSNVKQRINHFVCLRTERKRESRQYKSTLFFLFLFFLSKEKIEA